MFAHSYSIKMSALEFSGFLESIFCILLVVEDFSLQKVVEIPGEGIVSWWEVRWKWQMKQNFIAQFVQLLKHWLFKVVRLYHREELGPFCWPMLAAGIAVFTASHLLSILFRCNVFTRIQKAVVGQTSSRPPNSEHDIFWCKFGFGKCFGASS